jgi:branched-subunit amino acid ABC-type transport system permease component
MLLQFQKRIGYPITIKNRYSNVRVRLMEFERIVAQALTGFASASNLFLIACGLTIIFGVTRIVNFAHGSIYMLGAYFAVTLVEPLQSTLGRTPGFWLAVVGVRRGWDIARSCALTKTL